MDATEPFRPAAAARVRSMSSTDIMRSTLEPVSRPVFSVLTQGLAGGAA